MTRFRSLYRIALLLFPVIAGLATKAQQTTTYPQADFRPPLDLPPSLAGNFGEVRSNHLHSGLDYRTNQRQGYPVYATADGFVSRTRIQIGGGGNIVYVDHPNGFTTVHMHLQRFSPKIEAFVRSQQIYTQTYNVDAFPLPGTIPVKKGEIIAWSGNTGSTAGPHLHFEIRDTKSEETINAQLFGIDIPDRVKPVINGLYLYRTNGKPFSEWTPRQYFQVAGSAGNYRLNRSPVIQVNGEFGLGLVTYDQSIAGGNRNGIFSLTLQVDGITVFRSELSRFSFADTRAVNSYIDYPTLMTQGITIQKAFTEPGNPLKIYRELTKNGLITLNDGQVHRLTILVADVKGNTSTLAFDARYNAATNIQAGELAMTKLFRYNEDNDFATPGLQLFVPKGNLYSDLAFRYEVTKKEPGTFSEMHHIHNRLTPVHDAFLLKIRPDSTLPGNLYAKAVIVDSRGFYQGGDVENGFIRASPRYFGNFCVKIDTVPPAIVPVSISDGRNLASASAISLRISDNLSGVKIFNGYIDGKWVLMEFNSKTSTLFYTFDGSLPPGDHVFRLSVIDNKQNERIYSANFTR